MSAPQRQNRRLGVLLLGPLLLTLLGCGKPAGSVSGTVTFQDKPLPSGTVIFYSQDGTGYPATIRPDGTYALDKIPVGPAVICVVTQDPAQSPAARSPGMAMDPGKMGNPGAAKPGTRPDQPAGKYVAIPEHYRRPDQSNLSFDVASGENKHNIELK